MKVKPTDLKTAVKVSASLVDPSPAVAKKNARVGTTRLRVEGENLILSVTDGDTFLDWSIPCQEPTEQFEAYLPTMQFHEVVSKSASEGEEYEVSRSGGILQLTQENRNLRLRECGAVEFPTCVAGENLVEWPYPAKLLADHLKFLSPWIDVTNADGKSLATLRVAENEMTAHILCGSVRRIALSQGLPAVPKPLSFKQWSAVGVSEFLSHLNGDSATVFMGVDEKESNSHRYYFRDTSGSKRLTILADQHEFPTRWLGLFRNQLVLSELVVPKGSLMDSVRILNVLLPPEVDRLNIAIGGADDDGYLDLATWGEGEHVSKDRVKMNRKILEEHPEPYKLALNCRTLEEVLAHFSGNSLKIYVYRQHLCIQEVETVAGQERSKSLFIAFSVDRGGAA